MNGRRGLGAVLLVGGLAIATLGLTGLLGSGGTGVVTPTTAVPSPDPSIAPAPTTVSSGDPVTPTEAPATPAPATPAPTADVEALIRAFMSKLETAVRDGAQGSVAANLGGAVIDRYGVAQCEEYLASRDPSPEQRFEIVSVTGPAPWDYVTDGLTTTVPGTWTLASRVTGPNASGEVTTRDADLHVQVADGMVFWFTDCGTPLPSP